MKYTIHIAAILALIIIGTFIGIGILNKKDNALGEMYSCSIDSKEHYFYKGFIYNPAEDGEYMYSEAFTMKRKPTKDGWIVRLNVDRENSIYNYITGMIAKGISAKGEKIECSNIDVLPPTFVDFIEKHEPYFYEDNSPVVLE